MRIFATLLRPDGRRARVLGRDVVLQAAQDPDPAVAVRAWPMQHPELAVFCWSAAMLAVFAPLAVHLYRRKALS